MKTLFPIVVRAFTLLELLAVIAILALLAALLIPAANSIRKKAQNAHCLSNLAQINAASIAYSTDNNGQFPPNRINKQLGNQIFLSSLLPYLGDIPARPSGQIGRSPLVCPAAIDRTLPDSPGIWKGVYTPGLYGLSYAQNYESSGPVAAYQQTETTSRFTVERPSQLMLYMDYQFHYAVNTSYLNRDQMLSDSALLTRHNGSLNIAYADGSVRSLPIRDIPTLSTDPFWIGR